VPAELRPPPKDRDLPKSSPQPLIDPPSVML
jgi:hypothetical protein